jgi:hypothetical protein
MRYPVTIRKLCSSSVNNKKIQAILQTKKNNRNLNYNMLRENRKMMLQTVSDIRPAIKRVDETGATSHSMSHSGPYGAARGVKLPKLFSATPKTGTSGK